VDHTNYFGQREEYVQNTLFMQTDHKLIRYYSSSHKENMLELSNGQLNQKITKGGLATFIGWEENV
jgi:ABC-type uncharacterized transport system YnjBCD substrate-binding protein